MYITFCHFSTYSSFLQLKCTWSGISPKLGFHCRRIGLALSANRVPPQKCPFAWRELDSHLIIHGSLGPAESTAQTTSRSVQLFLQGSRPTDKPRKSIYNNRPHLHTSEMWPNNKLCNIVARDDTNQWHSIREIYSVRLYQSMNFLNAPRNMSPSRMLHFSPWYDNKLQNSSVKQMATRADRNETFKYTNETTCNSDLYVQHRSAQQPFFNSTIISIFINNNFTSNYTIYAT